MREARVSSPVFTPQAITMATGKTASALRLDDGGTIAPGKRADFVLPEGAHLADVAATRRIRAAWRAGRQVSA